MKKVISIIILLLFVIVYTISSSVPLMKSIVKVRSSGNLWYSDNHFYGDMYNLSNLPEFKKPLNNTKASVVTINCLNNVRDVNLYAILDSYLYDHINDLSNICRIKKFKYSRWGHDEENYKIYPDSSKNILLIEVSERSIRKYIHKQSILDKLSPVALIVKEGAYRKVMNMLFNSSIGQNLEYNLFEYQFLNCLKEIKATINYKWFNRVNRDVTIAPDKKYLLYNKTIEVNPKETTSSFLPVTNAEVDKLVEDLNFVNNYYKSLGFKEVYFSVIPNPVTILYPQYKNHNQIISKIYSHKNLEIKLIDVVKDFKNSNLQLYSNSDTHWNDNGYILWKNDFIKQINNLN